MHDFLNELGNPAYRHLLLNHLPIVGLAAGALALFVAFFLRGRAARIPALVVILVMSAAAYPVYETGRQAYKPVRRIADEAGVDWLDAHYDRAGAGVRAFYALAGLAFVALVVPIKWPRSGTPLAAATLLGAIACVGVGGWIAQAGGPIRHAELRPAASPSDATGSLPTEP
ncbi:MAG: hypothetical protein PHC88_14325 [Terrimicrobiaceae bacterium]|nr:hypothetical protein [Terrimicrobiaceae bacterium]